MPGTVKQDDAPNCYIFIATGIDFEPFTTGFEITKALLANGAWLASPFTPYRRDYKQGDRALFYVAGRGFRYVIGDAVLSGAVEEITKNDLRLAAKLGIEGFQQRIPLESIRLWEQGLSLQPLVQTLEFIKDKKNWGLHFRQAATRIPAADFETILKELHNGVVPSR